MGGLNEKKIKKFKFHRLKTWQIFLILVPLLFIEATILRFDNLKMTELRDAVLAADEAEDDEEISRTLEELKNFVFSHTVVNIIESNGAQSITFGTGTFYLEHQYVRAAQTAIAEAQEKLAESGVDLDGNVIGDASEICRPIGISQGWSKYTDCILEEVNKHPTVDHLENQIFANIPSTELYRKNYASPIWAPCLSGFVSIIILIILIILIVRFLIWIFLNIAVFFIK